ncbi:unnamed protein product [Closterium sp. NIES-53]
MATCHVSAILFLAHAHPGLSSRPRLGRGGCAICPAPIGLRPVDGPRAHPFLDALDCFSKTLIRLISLTPSPFPYPFLSPSLPLHSSFPSSPLPQPHPPPSPYPPVASLFFPLPGPQVRDDKPELSTWTLRYTAFGQNLEFSWLAKNLQPIHHQKIHWRSLDGLPNSGAVRFFPSGPNGCKLEMTISYEVPGILVPVANVRSSQPSLVCNYFSFQLSKKNLTF